MLWHLRRQSRKRYEASRRLDEGRMFLHGQAQETVTNEDKALRAEVEDWQQIDRWLAERPMPVRTPDVRPALLARIETDLEKHRRRGGRLAALPSAVVSSVGGVSGVLAGMLFLMLVQTPSSEPDPENELEMKFAASLLMPEDLLLMSEIPDPKKPAETEDAS